MNSHIILLVVAPWKSTSYQPVRGKPNWTFTNSANGVSFILPISWIGFRWLNCFFSMWHKSFLNILTNLHGWKDPELKKKKSMKILQLILSIIHLYCQLYSECKNIGESQFICIFKFVAFWCDTSHFHQATQFSFWSKSLTTKTEWRGFRIRTTKNVLNSPRLAELCHIWSWVTTVQLLPCNCC